MGVELIGEWTATQDRTLQVRGVCRFSTAGWDWAIEVREPRSPDQDVLVLDLTASAPTDGMVLQVVTDAPVEWTLETDHPYRQVQVFLDGVAEALTIEVDGATSST